MSVGTLKRQRFTFELEETSLLGKNVLLVSIRDSEAHKFVGYLAFARKPNKSRVLRLDDVAINSKYEAGKAAAQGSLLVTQAMNKVRSWARENGFSHIEFGYRARGNFGRISLKPRPRKKFLAVKPRRKKIRI